MAEKELIGDAFLLIHIEIECKTNVAVLSNASHYRSDHFDFLLHLLSSHFNAEFNVFHLMWILSAQH